MIKRLVKLGFWIMICILAVKGITTMYHIDFPNSPSPVAMLDDIHIPPQQSYDCWINSCMQIQP